MPFLDVVLTGGPCEFRKLGVHCSLSYHSGNKVIPLFCSTSIITTSS